MKISNSIIFSVLLVCVISLLGFAQNPIPNPGFENWTNGDPDLWYTNNVISLKPITQSTDSYAGNSSVRLEILNNTIPYSAILYADPGNTGTGFPCSQRYTTLSGYFKYSPQPNTLFHFALGMYQGGDIIGVANYDIVTSTSNWTPFNIPIVYIAPGDPDTCTLHISLTSATDVGAVAYLDELALSGSSGIKLNIGQVITQFELKQNYPNPFNPTTNIEFTIPQSAYVKLAIYNSLGQTAATLVDDRLSAGSYSVDWNAGDLPSGVYYYRMNAGGFSKARKLILMK